MISAGIARNRVLRTALEAMLANHHWPPFAGLEVLGQEKNPVSDHVRKHIQHDFVTGPLGLVVLHS